MWLKIKPHRNAVPVPGTHVLVLVSYQSRSFIYVFIRSYCAGHLYTTIVSNSQVLCTAVRYHLKLRIYSTVLCRMYVYITEIRPWWRIMIHATCIVLHGSGVATHLLVSHGRLVVKHAKVYFITSYHIIAILQGIQYLYCKTDVQTSIAMICSPSQLDLGTHSGGFQTSIRVRYGIWEIWLTRIAFSSCLLCRTAQAYWWARIDVLPTTTTKPGFEQPQREIDWWRQQHFQTTMQKMPQSLNSLNSVAGGDLSLSRPTCFVRR